MQCSARHLHISQPVSLRVPGNLIDPRTERLSVCRHPRIGIQSIQQTVDSLHPQGGSHVTGKKPPSFDQSRDHVIFNGFFRLQILFQDLLVADRDLFIERLIPLPELHDPLVQFLSQFRQEPVAIDAWLVHFIEKKKNRHPVTLQKTPQRQHMPLQTVRRTDDQHRIIQHLQRPLHLR